jgi:hypothetical protein
MFVAALLILGLALVVLLTTRDQPPRVAGTVVPMPAPVPFAEALASSDEREVLAAIDATNAQGRPLPSLLLYHPNPRVVKRTLATMSGRDVTPYLVARRLKMARAYDAMMN